MIPGGFIIPSKGTNQLIPPSGPVDGGTMLLFADAALGISGDRFYLPISDTRFSLQLQVVFSSVVSARPTWLQVELMRCRLVGPTWNYNSTGKSRPSVVQPGTTTFPFVFPVDESVDADDGAYGWTVTHNGTGTVRVEVNIYRAINEKANQIYRDGGWNQLSDGSVSRDPWKQP